MGNCKTERALEGTRHRMGAPRISLLNSDYLGKSGLGFVGYLGEGTGTNSYRSMNRLIERPP